MVAMLVVVNIFYLFVAAIVHPLSARSICIADLYVGGRAISHL